MRAQSRVPGAPVHGVAHSSAYVRGARAEVAPGAPRVQRSAARIAASIPGKANTKPESSSRPGSTR